MNILIVQQLAWGLRIGHSLACALAARGHTLSALVHGLQTWKHLCRQRDVVYAHRSLVDTVYDEGFHAAPAGVLREIEDRYALDSVWRLIGSDRVLAFTFQSSRHFTYRKPHSNDYLLSVLVAAYYRVREVLDAWPTDGVVAPNVAWLMNYVLYLECQYRKIPFHTIGFSRFGRTFFIGDDEYMTSAPMRERYAELREKPEASPRYEDARRLYARLVSNEIDVRPSYLPRVTRERPAERLLRLLSQTARLPVRLARATVRFRPTLSVSRIWLPNNSRAQLLRGVLTNYLEEWGRPDRQGPAIRSLETITFDYVFVPLQLEPEMTLMTWAPQFANQLELCRRLAMALPAGVRLLVKEHPNMVPSRRRSYYDKLRGLLNVELAHSSIPAPKIFSHPRCRAVATVNSTAGFEAAVTGVPVVLLGSAVFQLLPGVERARTYEDAITALHRACLEPRRPVSDDARRATVAYLAALLEHGFEADYQEVWTGRDGRVDLDLVAERFERSLLGQISREDPHRSPAAGSGHGDEPVRGGRETQVPHA